MASNGSTVAIIGGVIALIGQFWGSNYYLSALGGIVAIIGGFMARK